MEEIADYWNLPAAIKETVAVLPAELSESKPIDINEEMGCDENDDVPEEGTLAITVTLEAHPEMFHDIEIMRIKARKLIQAEKGVWQSSDK